MRSEALSSRSSVCTVATRPRLTWKCCNRGSSPDQKFCFSPILSFKWSCHYFGAMLQAHSSSIRSLTTDGQVSIACVVLLGVHCCQIPRGSCPSVCALSHGGAPCLGSSLAKLLVTPFSTCEGSLIDCRQRNAHRA